MIIHSESNPHVGPEIRRRSSEIRRGVSASAIVVALSGAVLAVGLATPQRSMGAEPAPSEPPGKMPRFQIRRLCLDANEGIAAGDVDGDGEVDLVAGRNWYRGGDWTPRPLRMIEDWNGYVQSNGDYLADVDGDGRLDVIAGSFLPTEIHWYQNPGAEDLRLGKLWPKKVLVDTQRSKNEGQLMADLDGDGAREWIVNSWDKKTPVSVWRFQFGDADQVAAIGHVLGNVNGHGLAAGDVNGDGRPDVLVGSGWYEQPAQQPWSQPWTLHQDWDVHSSLPMLLVDLDDDGDNDLIFGNGHDFGLRCWQNEGAGEDGKIQWTEHLIDDSYSQVHTLAFADISGDGHPDLVAGKRYFAHNGRDPGGDEMPCLYYYTLDPVENSEGSGDSAASRFPVFTRHTIDEGHVGCGLQIVAEDLDGDGDVDLAVAGKSGTHLILVDHE